MQHCPICFLQDNYVDIPDNAIKEMKDKEHKKFSVTEKVTSYFNIFEWGRNLLYQLDVTYQQEFMATSALDEYYKEMKKILIKTNIKGANYAMKISNKQSLI